MLTQSLQAFINPELEPLENSGTAIFFEGCLSVKGYTALVPRHRAVRLTARDLNGLPVTLEAKGWKARILQHEVDHLNGKIVGKSGEF